MTDAKDAKDAKDAPGATDTGGPSIEREKLKRTFEEMRQQVTEVLEQAREDASKTWKEDKAVLKEKLVDIDKVKADLDARIDKGYAKAQETWAEDQKEILERAEEVKKSLKLLSEKGFAKAQETWALDKEDLQEKVDDVKKAIKGGWDTVSEKTAGLLNKLLE